MTCPRVRIFGVVIAGIFIAGPAFADSVASRNKEGNKRFLEGKYQEAEKAYLEAQLESPGRPELLYNLGNALVKQKKYDPGIQSLRQAVGKAGGGLQANGWFNLGNAFYEAGNMTDAIQAYIQALHSNPSDQDAKHNLELSLRRLQEQKQSASGNGSKDSQQKKDDAKQEPRDSDRQQKQKDGQERETGQQQDKARQQQPAGADRRDSAMNKERALQILDAMKNQELAEQRKLLERQAVRRAVGKDW